MRSRALTSGRAARLSRLEQHKRMGLASNEKLQRMTQLEKAIEWHEEQRKANAARGPRGPRGEGEEPRCAPGSRLGIGNRCGRRACGLGAGRAKTARLGVLSPHAQSHGSSPAG